MEKLQLAMLTQWAEDAELGGIQGRKRMQKVVYFLQQAGCPIAADYTLHHFGPYSRDVANTTDLMVAEDLLDEQGGGGGQYEYTLFPQTRSMIDHARTRQADAVREFEMYKENAITLLKEELWTLELGSTILYFLRAQQAEPDWDRALRDACEYKRTNPGLPGSKAALELAKRFAVPAA